jgi:hypothetical protein
MPRDWRPIMLTLAACAIAWLGWVACGWVIGALGLRALDVPARVCAVFLVLGLAERFTPRHA